MTEETRGEVKVAPEVLITVVRRAALSVAGVAQLGPRGSGRAALRVLRGSGVEVTLEESRVTVDLSLVAEPEIVISDLGYRLQQAVKRSVEEIVGMPVAAVNILVDDVRFAGLEA